MVYETLPTFCVNYKMQGHNLKTCKKGKLDKQKDKKLVRLEYREVMKQIPLPTSMDLNPWIQMEVRQAINGNNEDGSVKKGDNEVGEICVPQVSSQMVSSGENILCKLNENQCPVSHDQEINNEFSNQVLLEENVYIENFQSKEPQEGMEDVQMPEEEALTADMGCYKGVTQIKSLLWLMII